jgi:hypothetical protein
VPQGDLTKKQPKPPKQANTTTKTIKQVANLMEIKRNGRGCQKPPKPPKQAKTT